MPNESRLQDVIDEIITALQNSIGTSSGAAHTIADANFEDRKFPWETGTSHPGCFVFPVQERITPATNLADDWGHGLQVTITQKSNRDLTSNRDRLYYWRQRAMGRFIGNQRLPNLTDIYTTVEPAAVIDPLAFGAGYDATSFVIRCMDRQTRPVSR